MPAAPRTSDRNSPGSVARPSAARTESAGTGPARRRRGRPSADEQRDTRGEVIDAARVLFGDLGYDGTTMIAVAERAGVTPTSVYHYFDDKAALYEGVFAATAPYVWSAATDALVGAASVVVVIERIVASWGQLEVERPGLTPFMLSVPREARLHPEFAPLSERRSQLQDAAFRRLAKFGRATGELSMLSDDDAFEFLRATVMGWIIEGHNRQQSLIGAPRALQRVVSSLHGPLK